MLYVHWFEVVFFFLAHVFSGPDEPSGRIGRGRVPETVDRQNTLPRTICETNFVLGSPVKYGAPHFSHIAR